MTEAEQVLHALAGEVLCGDGSGRWHARETDCYSCACVTRHKQAEDALHVLAGHVRCALQHCPKRWVPRDEVAYYASDGPVCAHCLAKAQSRQEQAEKLRALANGE